VKTPRGIEHVYIKPATTRLNGKVERSHRIDAEEFYRTLGGVVVDDSKLFTSKLQEWEDFYNFRSGVVSRSRSQPHVPCGLAETTRWKNCNGHNYWARRPNRCVTVQ
jgi:hypothetical protein